MIATLIELAEAERDRLVGTLAALVEERRVLAEERKYWRSKMGTPTISVMGSDDIARWLTFAARADRELQNLAEKDFLVEERISECRTDLLDVSRRIETLKRVRQRRDEARQQVLQRRQGRELSQRGVARRAKEEAEGEPWD